mmetsp:Transcript_35629/g.100167  ORF Transcript_35629/g.100167 Transcript_35629/m.100167 type:complete len:206 (+) Transcript_35629:718-1335(+)
MVLLEPVWVVPQFKALASRSPYLEAVLGDEREPVERAEVRPEELRVAAADDVRHDVLPRVECTQELLDLPRRSGELWPGLEFPQCAVVVEEERSGALGPGPELLEERVPQRRQGPGGERRGLLIALLIRGWHRGQFNAAFNEILRPLLEGGLRVSRERGGDRSRDHFLRGRWRWWLRSCGVAAGVFVAAPGRLSALLDRSAVRLR